MTRYDDTSPLVKKKVDKIIGYIDGNIPFGNVNNWEDMMAILLFKMWIKI
jgi:hypothetical protein